MKKVKATFKGRNGSMGFVAGKEYLLYLEKYGNGSLLINTDMGMGWCIYGSFLAFLNNWNLIETV